MPVLCAFLVIKKISVKSFIIYNVSYYSVPFSLLRLLYALGVSFVSISEEYIS